ncbi:bacteriocin immunity protein [Pseudomonas sp. MDMC216]|nr:MULTISPECIES: bacteriocin immunity protein [unclassified Pseudomonas]MDI5992643.1 bacteriocin immunity protein [Pseudomonas sp. MDMC216]MDI6005605.1 bacteriocin immunity protein [Pseudomonas sp. MDMC17]
MTGSKKITIKTQLQDYSESEFLELLRKVFDADFLTPDEYDDAVHEVVRLAEHPKGTDIIFYPEPGVDDSPEGALEFIKAWLTANGLPGFRSI